MWQYLEFPYLGKLIRFNGNLNLFSAILMAGLYVIARDLYRAYIHTGVRDQVVPSDCAADFTTHWPKFRGFWILEIRNQYFLEHHTEIYLYTCTLLLIWALVWLGRGLLTLITSPGLEEFHQQVLSCYNPISYIRKEENDLHGLKYDKIKVWPNHDQSLSTGLLVLLFGGFAATSILCHTWWPLVMLILISNSIGEHFLPAAALIVGFALQLLWLYMLRRSFKVTKVCLPRWMGVLLLCLPVSAPVVLVTVIWKLVHRSGWLKAKPSLLFESTYYCFKHLLYEGRFGVLHRMALSYDLDENNSPTNKRLRQDPLLQPLRDDIDTTCRYRGSILVMAILAKPSQFHKIFPPRGIWSNLSIRTDRCTSPFGKWPGSPRLPRIKVALGRDHSELHGFLDVTENKLHSLLRLCEQIHQEVSLQGAATRCQAFHSLLATKHDAVLFTENPIFPLCEPGREVQLSFRDIFEHLTQNWNRKVSHIFEDAIKRRMQEESLEYQRLIDTFESDSSIFDNRIEHWIEVISLMMEACEIIRSEHRWLLVRVWLGVCGRIGMLLLAYSVIVI